MNLKCQFGPINDILLYISALNMQKVPDRMLDAKGENEFDIIGTGLQQDREIRYITNEQYLAIGAVPNIMMWILQDPLCSCLSSPGYPRFISPHLPILIALSKL